MIKECPMSCEYKLRCALNSISISSDNKHVFCGGFYRNKPEIDNMFLDLERIISNQEHTVFYDAQQLLNHVGYKLQNILGYEVNNKALTMTTFNDPHTNESTMALKIILNNGLVFKKKFVLSPLAKHS